MRDLPLHFNQETFLDPTLGFKSFHHVQDDQLWHDHDFFEIAWIISGRGFHVTQQHRKKIKAGTVLFINTQEPHRYEFNQPIEVLNMVFSQRFLTPLAGLLPSSSFLIQTFLSAFIQNQGQGSFLLPLSKGLQNKMRKLSDELLVAQAMSSNQPSSRLAQTQIRFLSILFLLETAVQFEEPTTQPSEDQVRALYQVIEELHRDYHKPVVLDKVAKRHGFHPATWGGIFKKITGTTPSEHLLQIRLQKSCFFLKYTETPISEVGKLSGFSQETLFHRQFKNFTGMSPRAYRTIRGEGLRKIPKQSKRDHT
jgi:AraC-like DNA-binding protein